MNPCQSCGACCVSLRVSFPVDEVDGCLGGLVPQALTESYGSSACMRTMADGRCVALRGIVGEEVSCAIYELRPSSCREFAPLAALGRSNAACTDARRRHRLPSLA